MSLSIRTCRWRLTPRELSRAALAPYDSSAVSKDLVPTAVFQSLIVALVLSRLDYCNSVLTGLPVNLIRRLLQNAAARLIFGIRRSEHITYALASLHWLRVPERILFKVAVLTYRAVNGSPPEYLSSYFTQVANAPSRLWL